MSYEPDPEYDALVSAGRKFNAWIQKMYNLLNYERDGPRDVRLYGSRAKMQPTQELINARTYFYTLGRITDDPELKKLCKILREDLNLHADTHGRFPLPYEDLDDVFTPPTTEQMNTGLKVSSISAKSREQELKRQRKANEPKEEDVDEHL